MSLLAQAGVSIRRYANEPAVAGNLFAFRKQVHKMRRWFQELVARKANLVVDNGTTNWKARWVEDGAG